MSASSKVQQAEYILKSMLFDPTKVQQLGVYPWASEASRWSELVVILASQVCNKPEDDIRPIIKYLSDMGHLEIEKLAKTHISGEKTDREDEEVAKIIEILNRKGVPEEEAMQILSILSQLSRKLKADFGGKIQLYLRHYGDIMLSDIPDLFTIKGFGAKDTRRIFALWLQKVMNMPILVPDPVVSAFCKKNNLGVAELIEAADNINMNVAIVDELLRLEEKG